MRKTRQLMPSNTENSRKRESNVDSFFLLLNVYNVLYIKCAKESKSS